MLCTNCDEPIFDEGEYRQEIGLCDECFADLAKKVRVPGSFDVEMRERVAELEVLSGTEEEVEEPDWEEDYNLRRHAGDTEYDS
jgi:hypothetical protein